MIKIQASIARFGTKPCTLFSAYDEEQGLLVFSVEADYRKKREDGCFVIADDASVDYDMLFAQKDVLPAINAFYALKNDTREDGKSSRLIFSDRAARSNPDQAIERTGFNESGYQYNISDAISAAQVAAIAACLYASKCASAARTVRFAEELAQLSQEGILTI